MTVWSQAPFGAGIKKKKRAKRAAGCTRLITYVNVKWNYIINCPPTFLVNQVPTTVATQICLYMPTVFLALAITTRNTNCLMVDSIKPCYTVFSLLISNATAV